MRFILKQSGVNGERLGVMTGFSRSPEITIETPNSSLVTKGGSVPHLTADVLSRVFHTPQLLWVPISNSMHLETGARALGEGVAQFSGLGGYPACVSLDDLSEEIPQGHFEKDSVPVWTRNGKKMITADKYMDLMEVFKPEIMLAIADGRTSLSDGHKRISKSLGRTCNMLDLCVKRFRESPQLKDKALIGVIVGGSHDAERIKCIQCILKNKQIITGVALTGLTEGGKDTLLIPVNQVEPIFQSVSDALPPDLIRIVEGCWNPVVTMAAIAHGWDVFDGSYPVKLTNSGQALVFEFNVAVGNKETCVLDLIDKRYKYDFQPILTSCICLACTKHTRAYINHLLNTREMLAQVLLNIHNLHHYMQLFQYSRKHIAENTFPVFREHITKQYEQYQFTIDFKRDKSDTESLGECKKKRRLSSNIDLSEDGA